MPVYVYQCKNCSYVFEQHQSLSEEALTTCPKCHQGTLRKKFGQVGVVFKGSGFYANDKGK